MEKSAVAKSVCVGPPPDPLGGDHHNLKEALHIQVIPAEERFNRDGGWKSLVARPL